MTTTTTATHPAAPFEHELVLHDGPGELVNLMVPFVREGEAAGDHVVVLGEPAFVDRLLAAVPPHPDLEVIAEAGAERTPGRDLHRFLTMLDRLDRTGQRLRVVNQMPTTSPAPWFEWRRYEAAVNVALARYRAWGTCAYDLAGMDESTRRDLIASHPFVRTAAGRGRSEGFDEHDFGARDALGVPPHPVERTEPALALVDPAAAVARRAVREVAVASRLSQQAQEAVVFATSEAVANAWAHGRPPVRVSVWAHDTDGVTVSVNDTGPGPDPLVGLIPAERHSLSGHGMWLVHLLLGDIHHRVAEDGYTVTFGAGGRGGHPSPVAPDPR